MTSRDIYQIGQSERKNRLHLAVSFLLALALSTVAYAEEAHEGSAHSLHKHHAALFVGNTQGEHGESGISAGLDYEYRLNQWLGLGLGIEYAGGDFEHLLITLPLSIHPYKGWRLVAGIGSEIHKAHEDETIKREWVIRTGIGYNFSLGKSYSIAPEVYADFSEHETLFVFGLAIGFGW